MTEKTEREHCINSAVAWSATYEVASDWLLRERAAVRAEYEHEIKRLNNIVKYERKRRGEVDAARIEAVNLASRCTKPDEFELEIVKRDRAEWKAKAVQLEAAAEVARTLLEGLQADLAQARAERDAYHEHANALETERDIHTGNCPEDMSCMECYKCEAGELYAEREQLKAQLATVEAERDEYRCRARCAEEGAANIEAERDELRRDFEARHAKLVEVADKYRELQAQLATLRTAAERLGDEGAERWCEASKVLRAALAVNEPKLKLPPSGDGSIPGVCESSLDGVGEPTEQWETFDPELVRILLAHIESLYADGRTLEQLAAAVRESENK